MLILCIYFTESFETLLFGCIFHQGMIAGSTNEWLSIFCRNTDPGGRDFLACIHQCPMSSQGHSRPQLNMSQKLQKTRKGSPAHIYYALKCTGGQGWMFLVSPLLYQELERNSFTWPCWLSLLLLTLLMLIEDSFHNFRKRAKIGGHL